MSVRGGGGGTAGARRSGVSLRHGNVRVRARMRAVRGPAGHTGRSASKIADDGETGAVGFLETSCAIFSHSWERQVAFRASMGK